MSRSEQGAHPQWENDAHAAVQIAAAPAESPRSGGDESSRRSGRAEPSRGSDSKGGEGASLPPGSSPLAVIVAPPAECGLPSADMLAAPPPAAFVPSCSAAQFQQPLPTYLMYKGDVAQPTTPSKHVKPSHEPWRSGSAIAVHDGTVIAADRDNGALVLMQYSATGNSVVTFGKPQLVVGGGPEQLVVGPGGVVWATLRDSGEVIRLGPSAAGSVQRWKVGNAPIGLALDHNARMLAVVVSGDQRLLILHADTGKKLASAKTQADPRAVAWTATGHLWVAHLHTAVLRWNAAKLLSTKLDLPSVLPLQRSTLLNDPTVGIAHEKPMRAQSIAIDPTGKLVGVPHAMARTGDPSKAHLVAALTAPPPEENEESWKLPPKPPPPYYGEAPNAKAKFDSTARQTRPLEAELSVFATQDGNAALMHAMNDWQYGFRQSRFVAELLDPVAIAFHPTHSLVFVVGEGSDSVLVLDTDETVLKNAYGVENKTWPMAPRPMALMRTGHGPRGIAISADGELAFVLNAQRYTISVFKISVLLDAKFGTGKQTALLCAASEVPFGKSPFSPQQTLGRRLFTHAHNKSISFNGDLACASCHIEGGDDKLTWVGSIGARQTPSLAGRLVGTAPFNWAGSAGSLVENMQLTVDRLSGTGLCKQQLDWLKEWLTKGMQTPKNPHRAADGKLTAEQKEGQALFMDPQVGCAGCHVPGTWSDGSRHDVGTTNESDIKVNHALALQLLKASWQKWGKDSHDDKEQVEAALVKPQKELRKLDTPSLLGLWASAPYLHDGSAGTLKDVLDKTAGTMGHTAHLSSVQKDRLVAFLLTL